MSVNREVNGTERDVTQRTGFGTLNKTNRNGTKRKCVGEEKK
jgi:hypothetical protein